MPVPNLPEKLDAQPLVTPEKNAEYKAGQLDGDLVEPPEAVVLCYSRSLMDYVTENYDGREVDHYYGKLFVLDDTEGAVGVLGNFGIGAPTTAMLMDELIVDGVDAFLSVGFAGCFDESIEMGEFIVPRRAIRDEGTSHQYRGPAKWATASEPLVAETTGLLADRNESFHEGPTWTTDAIYRETKLEVERYASEGVLTVEMEAAAVFAVAAHRGVDAAAMFVVSDYLGLSDWEPKFHLTAEDMRRLVDTAIGVLDGYVN